MAVPKRQTSHSNTRRRRATSKVTPVALVTTSDGVPVRAPRRLTRAAERK